ncbi:MAG: hypothetical protein ACRCT1_02515 [Microcoleaceae cyanobacterium]
MIWKSLIYSSGNNEEGRRKKEEGRRKKANYLLDISKNYFRVG